MASKSGTVAPARKKREPDRREQETSHCLTLRVCCLSGSVVLVFVAINAFLSNLGAPNFVVPRHVAHDHLGRIQIDVYAVLIQPHWRNNHDLPARAIRVAPSRAVKSP